MKLISKILTAILIILIFGIELKNMQEVVLRLYLDYEIKSPLALMLFGIFLIGAVMGVLAMMPTFFRQRRDLSKLKKTITAMQKESAAHQQSRVQPPQPDSIVN